MNKKKILSTLLAVSILATNSITSAYACSSDWHKYKNEIQQVTIADNGDVYGYCGEDAGNIEWYLDTSGVMTISGSGRMYEFNTWFTCPWNEYKKLIKKVVVEEGVEYIGNSAFKNCNKLAEISLSDSVKEIGMEVFSGCRSLKSISIPENVQKIGSFAFEYCEELKTIYLPNSLEYIYGDAFTDCEKLESIEVSSENERYTSVDGVLYTKNLDEIVKYPTGKAGDTYTIPDTVRTIGESAFRCSYLISVDIPDSVTKIENDAFNYSTKLQEILIPDSVESIGECAFSGCCELKNVRLPSGIDMIADHTFYENVSLTSVEIPEGVESIESGAFSGCISLKEIKLPDSLKDIGSFAFADTSLVNVKLPDNLVTIGVDAFISCQKLESIEIPAGVSEISDVFSGCTSLSTIKVAPENENYVVVDGVLFFKDMKTLVYYPPALENQSYTIPQGVECINWYAFMYSGITSVIIPESVVDIGGFAFADCKSLKEVVIPDGVKYIGESAFSGCFALEKVEMADSVLSLGVNAFLFCNSLSSVSLSRNLEILRDYTFAECPSLKDVFIPMSVNTIETGVFSPELQEIHYEGTENSWNESVFKVSDIPSDVKVICNAEFADNQSETVGAVKRICGDLDGNGIVELTDLSILAMSILGDVTLTDVQTEIADVNGDSKTDIADLAHLKQYISKDNVKLFVK